MRLDTATFAFGYKVKTGGSTPNWGTSLGQSQINAYKINNYDGLNEIIKGMIYTSKSADKISTKIGKGGTETFGNTDDSPIVLGSLFTKVKVNDVLIPNGKFILLITRDTAESHKGRLKLKYGPNNKISDSSGSYTNEMFFAAVRNTLGLADKACWFVSELSVENQDTLKLKAIIVNKDCNVEYEDTKKLHEAWSKLEPSLIEISDENTKAPNNFIPLQTILYGVPGCGKSFAIKKLLAQNKISSENTIRVVFHPEYTNSDFIGQILPKLKKSESGENVIDYQFTAGPFTQILRKAYSNPNTNFALIIEEINRGNAASIFGELFQLLDRLDEDDTESNNVITYTKGWSSYGVHNDCINAYLCGLYDEEGVEEEQPAIHFDVHSAIRLPANLSLFATMNTSDQNVFSLDNAFKRRWDLRLIPNKFVFDSDDTKENKKQFEQCFAKIEGFDFTWGAFLVAINNKIVGEQSGDDISSFEDKQIGMWFVKATSKEGTDEKIIRKETFIHKVIEYLFDDVFKLDSSILFTKNSLSELVDIADGDSPKSIFANGIVNEINAKQAEFDKLKESANLG